MATKSILDKGHLTTCYWVYMYIYLSLYVYLWPCMELKKLTIHTIILTVQRNHINSQITMTFVPMMSLCKILYLWNQRERKEKLQCNIFFSTPPYLFSLMTLIGSLLKPRAPLLHTQILATSEPTGGLGEPQWFRQAGGISRKVIRVKSSTTAPCLPEIHFLHYLILHIIIRIIASILKTNYPVFVHVYSCTGFYSLLVFMC